ncbi:MAG: hypothetical protein ACRDKB_04540 [Actinomycetota bacterium]
MHNGIYISAGAWFGSQPVGDNEASQIVAKWNTVRLVDPFLQDRPFFVSAVRLLGALSGTSNRVTDVSFTHNVIDGAGATGITVLAGVNSLDNRISEIKIRCNRVKGGKAGDVSRAGISVVGAHSDPGQLHPADPPPASANSRDNVVRNVRIARNSIKSPSAGIRLIGGLGSKARNNRVICVPLRGNRIDAPKKVDVRSNVDGASGNKARLAC